MQVQQLQGVMERLQEHVQRVEAQTGDLEGQVTELRNQAEGERTRGPDDGVVEHKVSNINPVGSSLD